MDQLTDEKPFAVERAKTGRAKCKKCKCPIDKDTVRIAKLVANPFSDGKMKAWHHLTCLFEVFAKQRASTKRIEDPEEDIAGWADLDVADRKIVLEKVQEYENSSPFKATTPGKLKRRKSPSSDGNQSKKFNAAKDTPAKGASSSKDTSDNERARLTPKKNGGCKDDAFREFRRICTEVANADAYNQKTAIVRKMLTKGTSGDGFRSDVKLWCKLLLPGVVQRIYNLQSKQLIKLFSRIFVEDEEKMLEHLEQGDVAETIREFFDGSATVKPATKSLLTIQEVDEFLEELSHLTKEDDQIRHFRSIIASCTGNDLKMIIRLIKHDLRINAGAKHILGAVHEDAYRAFQVSRDLNAVIERCLDGVSTNSIPKTIQNSTNSPEGNKVALSLMTPILPMLAEACKSVEMAMKKCPGGMLAEVKYDGERVQVHKKGSEFRYFSRSLKPVMPHKVNLFREYIPKAFPDGDDLILDSEVLLVDAKTSQPLPFGSLGVHKRGEFKDANVCLFVFDCIYYNGEVLLNKTMQERREILKKRMTTIPNRIMLSETQQVNNPRDLAEMIAKILKMGLEGLVLKDINGFYEPGKRHWLKVKKDYLLDGAMADSADLVVLGAWYGTGNKGGMLSVFLMGCYDEAHDVWLTVTKVHTGHDDATLARLQKELDMVKIGKDPSKVPFWLRANKPMVPDFVAKDPKKQPVWEITGAEFTNQGVHTAEGISIRFPRVTRIRHDKDWSTATTLTELRNLFNKSSESLDVGILLKSGITNENETKIKIEKPEAEESQQRENSSESPVTDVKIKTEFKREKREDASVKLEIQEEELAEYYAFVNKDYIEYSAAGSPLNWVEGRKPVKGLPADAKPLYQLTETELRNKTILKYCEVSFARNFRKKKKKRVRTMLKTCIFNYCDLRHRDIRAVIKILGKSLGARILKDEDRSRSTYVIHDCKELPWSDIQEYKDVPKTARHVNVTWVEAVASESEIQDTTKHAVALAADYCACPCEH